MSDATNLAEGLKFDTEKPDWALMPWRSLQEVVEVLTFGEKKYNPDGSNPGNWRRVPDWDRRYFAATIRHLLDWMEGDRLDTETGCSHLAHAACCILFMLAKDREHNYSADSEAAATLEHYQAQMIASAVELALADLDRQDVVQELMSDAHRNKIGAA